MAGRGGFRPGAGRKPKPKAEQLVAPDDGAALIPPESEKDPLGFLLFVMNDPTVDKRLRVRAAIAAAQYTNTKKADGGKKEEKAEAAAKVAGGGRFAPAQGPRLVVNNKR